MKKLLLVLLVVAAMMIPATPAFADGDDDGRVIFGGDVAIKSGEVIDGDLVVFGGNVTLENGSKVDGNLVAMGGNVAIAGEVAGDTVAMGGNVKVEATAVINGDLVMVGGTVHRAEGAKVKGRVVDQSSFPGVQFRRPFPFTFPRVTQVFERPWEWGWLSLAWSLLRWFITAVVLVALGLIVVALWPKPTELVGQVALAQVIPSLGVGFLTAIVASILLPLLVVICIGIPAAVLLGLALGIAWLFGWLAIGLLIGQKVLAAIQKREVAPMPAVALGVFLLTIITWVPCLGWLLGLLASLWGLGAVVLTRFGTQPYPVPPTSAAPPAVASV